jgi:hypothetical protein
MTTSETRPPPPGLPRMISSKEDSERLEHALEDMMNDQWINDFIQRLDRTIEDISRKK